MQPKKTTIWLALLALYFVWGSTYLAIRITIETFPPFFQAAVRFLVSGLLLLLWQYWAGQALPTRRQWLSAAIVGGSLLVAGNGLVSWAEQYIPSGITALIVATIPMFLVIGEALRPTGAKPNWQGVLGLLVGFAGVFILVGPTEISGSSIKLNPYGVIALLFASLFWAFGSLYSRSADLPKSTLMSTGAQMLTGSVGLFCLSLLTDELSGWELSAVSLRSWSGLLYLIVAGSLVGFASYGWLLQNAPISLVSTYAYVNPVVAVLLGAWLGHEPLEPRIGLATTIIIGAVIFINSTRQKTRAHPHGDGLAVATVSSLSPRNPTMPLFIAFSLTLAVVAQLDSTWLARIALPAVLYFGLAWAGCSVIAMALKKHLVFLGYDGFASSTLLIWLVYWLPQFVDGSPLFFFYPLYFALTTALISLFFVGTRQKIDADSLSLMAVLADKVWTQPSLLMIAILGGLAVPQHFMLYPTLMTLLVIRFALDSCLKAQLK